MVKGYLPYPFATLDALNQVATDVQTDHPFLGSLMPLNRSDRD